MAQSLNQGEWSFRLNMVPPLHHYQNVESETTQRTWVCGVLWALCLPPLTVLGLARILLWSLLATLILCWNQRPALSSAFCAGLDLKSWLLSPYGWSPASTRWTPFLLVPQARCCPNLETRVHYCPEMPACQIPINNSVLWVSVLPGTLHCGPLALPLGTHPIT